jgi:hypothetical protein
MYYRPHCHYLNFNAVFAFLQSEIAVAALQDRITALDSKGE